MDEITLRLPTAATAALRAEADERGTTVEEHLYDIIDAYRADDKQQTGQAVEYIHTVGHSEIGVKRNSTTESNEIGSFQYGSRSILSESGEQ